MFKKKLKSAPVRTQKQINDEYNQIAPLASHKMTTIKLLEDEIQEHLDRMCELRRESVRTPQDVTPVPAPAQALPPQKE